MNKLETLATRIKHPAIVTTVIVVGGIVAIILEWVLASKVVRYLLGDSDHTGWFEEIIVGGFAGNMLGVVVVIIIGAVGVGLYEVWMAVYKQIISQRP